MRSTGCGRQKVVTVSGMTDATGERGFVEVRRSARRRRTVSAYRDGDRTIVLIPARMCRGEERRWVTTMLERLARQDRKLRPGDDELMERATALSRRYLGGRPVPESVRWVANQGSRWGSCTPADGTIRLSARLQGMPSWVLDYVLVHELVHLLVPGHGPAFWAEVAAYPRAERARGYLEGVSAASGLTPPDDVDDEHDDPTDEPTDDDPTGDQPIGDDLTADVPTGGSATADDHAPEGHLARRADPPDAGGRQHGPPDAGRHGQLVLGIDEGD